MSAAPYLALLLVLVHGAQSTGSVSTMTFLLTVNTPWASCIHTVKTPPLMPDQKWNKTENIVVGKCDHGPLTYTVMDEGDGKSVVTVTYHSAAVDVMPPSCKIQWNYSYLEPRTQSSNESLLPGCYTTDSVEGYHMTDYWFHVLDWTMSGL